MNEKINLGMIGFGNIGYMYCEHIARGDMKFVNLAAICETRETNRDLAKSMYPNVPVFETAEEMMDSGVIDSVMVATPHFGHVPLTKTALSKGLHVLCDKPAGVYTKEVLEMNAAAKGSDKVFAMMLPLRTAAVFKTVKRLIDDGQLGHIKKIIWIVTDWYRSEAYHMSSSWRSSWRGEGGSLIMNQCPHNLDMWQWLFGMPDRLVSYCGWGKYYDIECDDDATVFFEYDNGTTGIFTSSTGETPGTNRLEISCDNGKVIVENGKIEFFRNEISEREFCEKNRKPFTKPISWRCEVPPKGSKRGGDALIMDNFAEAILREKPLIARGEEGINELTIANAVYLSDWLGNIKIDLGNFDHELYHKMLSEKMENSVVRDFSNYIVEEDDWDEM